MADSPLVTDGVATKDLALAAGTRLFLIRHGEAACNAESFIGGHLGCRGLTERGREQAAVLAARLATTGELDGCVALWTSILPRAVETAQILQPALSHLTIEQSCSLCERHPGEADGMTWEDYELRYTRRSLPGDHPDSALSNGGESWIAFISRAEAALYDLALRYAGRSVAIVAHGGIIDSSLIAFLELPAFGTKVRLHPDHTSITEWEFTGSRWRLVRYNDAAHLADPAYEPLRTPNPEWVSLEAPPLDAATQQV